MTADVDIYELTASDAGTDKTASTVRFKLADNQTVDNNDPITIPSGVDNTKSYWKQLRMYCASAPDTQIDNLRFYSDGSNDFGTGVSVNASNRGPTPGNDIDSNASSSLPDSQDLFGLTSGAPLDIDAIHTSAVTATGFFGDYIYSLTVLRDTVKNGMNCWKLLQLQDNQQPSLSRNTLEGSTTNSRLLTGDAEESNGDTSVLHLSEMMI